MLNCLLTVFSVGWCHNFRLSLLSRLLLCSPHGALAPHLALSLGVPLQGVRGSVSFELSFLISLLSAPLSNSLLLLISCRLALIYSLLCLLQLEREKTKSCEVSGETTRGGAEQRGGGRRRWGGGLEDKVVCITHDLGCSSSACPVLTHLPPP